MTHLKATRLQLAYLFGVAAAHAFAGSADAGNFPQKPLRIIVSSAPGGGQDLTVRPIAQQLAEQLGVAVVVDNRGGASGVIAMDLTRQSAPDGYTLLAGATSIILMASPERSPTTCARRSIPSRISPRSLICSLRTHRCRHVRPTNSSRLPK